MLCLDMKIALQVVQTTGSHESNKTKQTILSATGLRTVFLVLFYFLKYPIETGKLTNN